MTLQGRVENGVVVFQNSAQAAPLPEGTLVEVTPVRSKVSNPPGLYPVSKEQREALLGLIGLWKVENPPNDDEVERMIDEYRMRKYG